MERRIGLVAIYIASFLVIGFATNDTEESTYVNQYQGAVDADVESLKQAATLFEVKKYTALIMRSYAIIMKISKQINKPTKKLINYNFLFSFFSNLYS